MGFLRVRPADTIITRTRSTVASITKSHTKGRSYLYTGLRATQAKIYTEASRNAVHIIPTFSMGLPHLLFRISKLPYLFVERSFTRQPAVIHDCLVAVGKYYFLISAHYSPTAPVNAALKKLTPGFDWRGELIVVALGRNVPYLSKMRSQLATAAINKFIATFLIHFHMELLVPVAVM